LNCQAALLTEEVTGLAHRSDHVVVVGRGIAGHHRHDVLPGAVQCRPQQVVHGGVDNGEVLVFAVLQVLHLGNQNAGIGGDRAARLDEDFLATIGQARQQRPHIRFRRRRLLVMVGHTQATAQVNMLQGDAGRFEVIDQFQDTVEGVDKGRYFRQLGTDVAIDAFDPQVGRVRHLTVSRQRVIDTDTELVFFKAGGNVRMRVRIDIGIDAQ